MTKLSTVKMTPLSGLVLLSLTWLALATTADTCWAQNRVDVLALPDLSAWDTEVFSGQTRYEVTHVDGKTAVKAVSEGTASGLVRHMRIDLNKTPYMHWSWKIDHVLSGVDEQQKSGDDYAARLYVVISGGLFFWRTRAISYVWASRQPAGQVWPNAFTSNATMVAVTSGATQAGQWVAQKRNVLQDIKQLLGLDKTHIDAVAIMSDTDNSGQSATAYYGNIYFSAE